MPRRPHRYGDPTVPTLELKVYWTKENAFKKFRELDRRDRIKDPVSGKEMLVRENMRKNPTIKKSQLKTPVLGKTEYFTVEWFGTRWAKGE